MDTTTLAFNNAIAYIREKQQKEKIAASHGTMRDKFNEYLHEVGIRYAIQFAKYNRIRLGLVQLWIYEENIETDSTEVAKIYMQSPEE